MSRSCRRTPLAISSHQVRAGRPENRFHRIFPLKDSSLDRARCTLSPGLKAPRTSSTSATTVPTAPASTKRRPSSSSRSATSLASGGDRGDRRRPGRHLQSVLPETHLHARRRPLRPREPAQPRSAPATGAVGCPLFLLRLPQERPRLVDPSGPTGREGQQAPQPAACQAARAEAWQCRLKLGW